MALPNSVDPSAPASSASPAQGDDQLRGIKQYLVDVFGVPNASNVTAQATTVSTAGVVTINQSPFTVPTLVQGNASSILYVGSRYSTMDLQIENTTRARVTPSGMHLSSGLLLYAGTSALMTTSGMLNLQMAGMVSEARGDLYYRDGVAWTRLAAGTSGQLLRTQGTSNDPLWITGSVAGAVTTTDNPITWTGQHTWNAGYNFGFTAASAMLVIGTATPTQMLHVHGRGYVGSHIDIGGQARLTRGTVGSPAYSFEADSDTGIFSPGANQLSLATGGTSLLILEPTTGLMLQGTTPFVPASVVGTPAKDALYQNNVAKVLLRFTTTATIDQSFNVLSVANGGAGVTDVTIDRDFSNTNYICVLGGFAGSERTLATFNNSTAGVVRILGTLVTRGSPANAVDSDTATHWSLAMFGAH